jgi:hypothetical protein
MTSTERLLAVLCGRTPDRVPISTYELVGPNPLAWENSQESYRPLMDLIRQHTDCLYMTGVWPTDPAGARGMRVEKWDEGDQHFSKTTCESPTRTLTMINSWTDGLNTVWCRKHWCQDLDDLKAMMSRPFEIGPVDFSPLATAYSDLQDHKGLPLVSIGDPLCQVSELFEFGEFTVLAMTETATILKYIQQAHERTTVCLARVLEGKVKNAVFRICGPEYATPPYLPPELFAKFVSPFASQYVHMIRQAGAFSRIHCHGKIARVLDEIKGIGPDAIDPVEPIPDGDIDVKDVKAAIGRQICLMGGIELKYLEMADETFIRALTREIMAQGKPGRRFVIMPTAAPINVPLSPNTERNYRAFIQTALEIGGY